MKKCRHELDIFPHDLFPHCKKCGKIFDWDEIKPTVIDYTGEFKNLPGVKSGKLKDMTDED